MSNRYLIKKNNKAKKGISPVIATVILVAVAVVIAAALAGFSSSLFGTYSSAGAAVTVSTLTVNTLGGGNVELVNGGNVADELLSMQVVGREPAVLDAGSLSVPADGTAYGTGFSGLAATASDASAEFEEGQTITVRMNLKSGIQLTQSVIVNAAAVGP